MANVTVRMVAAKAGIRVPVDHAVTSDLVGRTAIFVEVLAVFIFDGGGISRTIRSGERGPAQRHDERGHRRAKPCFHGKLPRALKISKITAPARHENAPERF